MEDSSCSKPKRPTKHKFFRSPIRLPYFSPEFTRELGIYSRIKRIYFKEIDEYYSKKQNRRHYCSSGKQLKCLTGFKLHLYHESRDKKFVKLMKNLKNISIKISPENENSLDSLPLLPFIRFLKQMPTKIESIAISGSIAVDKAQIKSFYRNLSTCINLKTIEKALCYKDEDEDEREGSSLIKVEYDSINKYFPRLRKLKDFWCEEEKEEDLQKYIYGGMICPYTTGLRMVLFDDMDDMDDMDDPDPEEKTSFFRFHLFPKLERLDFWALSSNKIYLDRLMGHGFTYLFQLKELDLTLDGVIGGKNFLFEGLRNIRLLDSFALSIEDIESNEERLLVEFLRKQTQLVSLTLTLKKFLPSNQRCQEQNQHFEMICESLNDKPKLKTLRLLAKGLSIQSLSRGLSQVQMSNQIEYLDLEAYDHWCIPSSAPDIKIKGLCDFIERQKASLDYLCITLGYIQEDEVIDSLIKATGKADKVTNFGLKVNRKDNTLKEIPQEHLRGHISFHQTFSLLSQTLPKLKDLYSLTIDLSPLKFPVVVPVSNSAVVLNTLPTLKDLAFIELGLPFMRQSLKNNPAQALLLYEIKHLGTLCRFGDNSDRYFDEIEEINEVLKKTKLQRFLRSNLKLY